MWLLSLEYTFSVLIFNLLRFASFARFEVEHTLDLLCLLNSYKHPTDNVVVPGAICSIAASSNSSDSVQFIRIKKPCITETSSTDDYGHATAAGQSHIIEQFLEKSRSNSKGHYFKADSKTFYFYHESIVYPFAQFTEKKFH